MFSNRHAPIAAYCPTAEKAFDVTEVMAGLGFSVRHVIDAAVDLVRRGQRGKAATGRGLLSSPQQQLERAGSDKQGEGSQLAAARADGVDAADKPAGASMADDAATVGPQRRVEAGVDENAAESEPGGACAAASRVTGSAR